MPGMISEYRLDGRCLSGIVEAGGGTVGIDIVHLLRQDSAVCQSLSHSLGAAAAIGKRRRHVIGVAGDAIAQNLSVNGRAPLPGVVQLLQEEDA